MLTTSELTQPEQSLVRAAGVRRVPIGRIGVDCLTLEQGLTAIQTLVEARHGGTVVTPNIDHVVLAESNARLREAYAASALSFVDGTPLFWALRILGWPVPEKVSGSDLVLPLAGLAARHGWRVYLLGGGPGVAERAAERLRQRFEGFTVVGCDSPMIDMETAASQRREIVERAIEARPDLVLCALGTPKGELFAYEACAALRPALLMSIGASLDFIAGTVRRAPRIVSTLGLEWLYRLAREPRRLWRRYLVRDAAFVPIFLRALAQRRSMSAPA